MNTNKLKYILPLFLALLVSSCSILPRRVDIGQPQQERAARVAQEIAKIRNLELKKPVSFTTMDKAGLAEFLVKELDKEWEKEGAHIERVYKVFGLIPKDLDLKPWLADFMEGQIGGFYNPETKKLYAIANDDPSLEDEDEEMFVMAHETAHAIEDQHFDFLAAEKAMSSNQDAKVAYSALGEGSAMESGLDHTFWRNGMPFSLSGLVGRVIPRLAARIDADSLSSLAGAEEMEDEDMQKFMNAPPVIRAGLMFPYMQGWGFVSKIRSEFGWEAVDETFRDPPESTEQIIHPERYFDRRDRPVEIQLPAAPFEWKEIVQNTMGMQEIKVMLDSINGKKAGKAAEGWDGDRYVLWKTPAGDALGWRTVWDRPRQAGIFAKSMQDFLNNNTNITAASHVKLAGSSVVVTLGKLDGKAAQAADHLLTGKVVKHENDHTPPSPLARLISWPLSIRSLDRVNEAKVAGGRILDFRFNKQGHRLRLVDSWALLSERNPDRAVLSAGLGLIGGTIDRTLDYTYARVPFVVTWHRQGDIDGEPSQSRFGAALNTVNLTRRGEQKRFRLLWGWILDTSWGERDQTLKILKIPLVKPKPTAPSAPPQNNDKA